MSQKEVTADSQAHDPDAAKEKYGFGSSWLPLMLLLPPLVYYMWICMADHQGALYLPTSSAELLGLLHRVPAPNTASVAFVLIWFVGQILLQLYAPGQWVEGTPLDDGTRLPYKMNGWAALWITLLGAGLVCWMGWVPATFSHTGVAPGSCATCHNGTTAKGKPSGHVPTTQSCDVCHRMTAWTPATFSHTGVAPGTCATCHNGTTAKGKPSNHLPTTQSCDACHRTTTWDANFSHTSVVPGTCATCHNGVYAKGKPKEHPVTTQSCDACHTTKTFSK